VASPWERHVLNEHEQHLPVEGLAITHGDIQVGGGDGVVPFPWQAGTQQQIGHHASTPHICLLPILLLKNLRGYIDWRSCMQQYAQIMASACAKAIGVHSGVCLSLCMSRLYAAEAQ